MNFKWIILCILARSILCLERFFAQKSQLKGWYTGHNICVHIEYVKLHVPPFSPSHNESMACSGNDKEHICFVTLHGGSSLKKSYRCCPGYVRIPNSEYGCRKTKVEIYDESKHGNHLRNMNGEIQIKGENHNE